MRVLACVAAAAALGLAGCAPDSWDKADGTPAQFSQDQGVCKMFVLGMPMQAAERLPPVYTANTAYTGTYTGTGNMGMIRGNATTTVDAEPNPNQGLADLGAAIGNVVRERNAMRACMEARGYVRRVDAGVSSPSDIQRARYGTPLN